MTTGVIRDPDSAAPIRPYSQGIKADGFVFVAVEMCIDPPAGKKAERRHRGGDATLPCTSAIGRPRFFRREARRVH